MINKLIFGKIGFAIFLLCTVMVIASPAQTFKTLLSFSGTDGANPAYSLLQGSDGNVYGTTEYGGAAGAVAVFKITPKGKLTTLYSFCSRSNCADGAVPLAALIQATNGNFYGTTFEGGADGAGTIFEITPKGKLTTFYNFCSKSGCTDGASPYGAGLVQATNGNFYGTTYGGGAHGYGTVFEITAAGKLTTLHSFAGYPDDGESPVASLVQANGNFYGTTFNGGTNNGGTVFEITPKGKLTTLYSFCSQKNCTAGSYPGAALVQASNGNFYGTTASGGVNGNYGTIFETTSKGKLTTLHSFCSEKGCPDGAAAFGGLVRATNGIFYGATFTGGTDAFGTVFSLSGALGTR